MSSKLFLLLLIVLVGTSHGCALAPEPVAIQNSVPVDLPADRLNQEVLFGGAEWRKLKETSNKLLDQRENLSELQVRISLSADGIYNWQVEEFYKNVQHILDMAELSVVDDPGLPVLKIEARGTPKQANYGYYLAYSASEVAVHIELRVPGSQVLEMEATYRNEHPISLSESELKRNIEPGRLAYENVFRGGSSGGENKFSRDLIAFLIQAFGPGLYENMLSRSNELANYQYGPGQFDAERANAASGAKQFLIRALQSDICPICWVRFRSGEKAAMEIHSIVPAKAPPHYPQGKTEYVDIQTGFDDLRGKILSQSKIASIVQSLIDTLELGQESPATYENLRNLSGTDWGDNPKKWAEWWYSTSW